jgi:hypothetical protein
MWPTAVSYAVSYLFIAIVGVNHPSSALASAAVLSLRVFGF